MGTPTAPSPLQTLAERLESLGAVDSVAETVGKAVRDVLEPGTVKDALSGTWLGHAVHPPLTDVTIGSFLAATVLDVLGGDDDGRAAERLIAVGLAAVAPTALTGANDWADTEIADSRVRRVGLVHAGANVTAAGLMAASLAARRRGARGRGKLLALTANSVLAVSGYLGGHMSFVQGVGPNQTTFDEGPEDWTEVSGAGDLQPDRPKAVVVEDTPVLLLRRGDGVRALHDRCSHRGCSLSEGQIEAEIVTCACHGSRFDLRDGSVQRGPATAPQPVFDVRESGGRMELRLRKRV